MLRLLLFAGLLACSSLRASDRADDFGLTIVGFGDSTTGDRGPLERLWLARLRERLEERSWTVWTRNAGVPGGTTRLGRERFERDVLVHRPDLVVIQFGINDSAVLVGEGRTEPQHGLESYLADLESFVEAARAAGALPILMTPNPLLWTDALCTEFGFSPYRPDERFGLDVVNARYAEGVRMLAQRLGVVLVDVHARFRAHDAATGRLADWLDDGIHPSAAAHERIASWLLPEVVRAVEVGELVPKALRRPQLADAGRELLVDQGKARLVHDPRAGWSTVDGELVGKTPLDGAVSFGPGDFVLEAVLSLDALEWTAAAVRLGSGHFGFDGEGERLFVEGELFGGRVVLLEDAHAHLEAGLPFTLRVERVDDQLRVFLNDRWITAAACPKSEMLAFALVPLRATMRVRRFAARGNLVPVPAPLSRAHGLPVVDIADEVERQTIVDREPGQYLGHPTTLLLEDGRTMLCVYPKGHGRGAIQYKRSEDGGRTWSARLPTPASWEASRETPTLHRVLTPSGGRRILLFSGLYPIRLSISDDDGRTWTELAPIGDYGGIVAMASVHQRADGRIQAFFHDDGRFLTAGGTAGPFTVYRVFSDDGGATWSRPVVVARHPEARLCEPGLVPSPTGDVLALLLRENSRRHNSFIVFSHDGGETWSAPRELPAALTGDRHVGRYAPDGRLFLTFRDTTLVSATRGDWVGWVGTWDDLVNGTEGAYRVRLLKNTKAADCAYPGLELLPDGTLVTTTYGHWREGEEPFIVSLHLRLEELDARLAADRGRAR